MHPSPTGAQWHLSHAGQTATVVEVGGGLRTYAVHGRDVVAGYRADQPCKHGRGQVLMPWPNRIRDGRYEVGGTTQQLSLTEPARGNASHGLVRWALWRLVHQQPDTVEIAYALHPQPGWPWHLDLGLRYQLGDDGLTVTVTAANPSASAAPFGFGAHPYVAIGDTEPAAVTVEIPASHYLVVDTERMLPVETREVTGSAYDLRASAPLADRDLDTAYTGLAPGDDGRWRVIVGDVEVWGGPGLPWLQVFTEKAWLPTDGPDIPGIAVEPMTCPPNAFNSGTDLVWIGPGESWRAQWGIRLRAGEAGAMGERDADAAR